MTVAGAQTIEIDGRALAWRSLGDGPPLLLVNGYAATGGDWDPQLLQRLAETFEVIAPDNRGMGRSALGDPGGLTIDGMAHDLELLLDARGIDQAPVVGWSMGGSVAQQLALRAPARVERLVLLSTDPGGATAVAPQPEAWARLLDHSGSAREQATRLISLLFPPALARLSGYRSATRVKYRFAARIASSYGFAHLPCSQKAQRMSGEVKTM